jgi:simple sugar transport system substrate-binding protein
LRLDVAAKQRAIADGKLLPFGGRLVDQAGRVRQETGALDDGAIAHMDWFVQGVQGTLPAPK